MNKSELIGAIVSKNPGMTLSTADAALSAALESIKEAVAAGDKVTLIGFGTFEKKTRKARTGINPSTKEKIKIAKKNVPAFKAGSAFKEQVAAGKKKKKK